jgi:hypothetical protein
VGRLPSDLCQGHSDGHSKGENRTGKTGINLGEITTVFSYLDPRRKRYIHEKRKQMDFEPCLGENLDKARAARGKGK